MNHMRYDLPILNACQFVTNYANQLKVILVRHQQELIRSESDPKWDSAFLLELT